MAIIYQASATDRRCQLGAEELVRKMAFGTNWMRLRIGVRLVFYNAGANISNAGFAVGVCEGDVNTFSSNSTTNYVGLAIGAGGTDWTSTYSYTAGPPAYFVTASSHNYLQKGPGGLSFTTNAGSGFTVPSAPLTTNAPLYLEVTKLNNAFKIEWIAPTTPGASQTSYTSTQFLSGLETGTSLPFTGYATRGTATVTSGLPAFSWDTLSVVWTRNVLPVDILDIGVARFY